MERPQKRPRLSIFSDHTPDAELDHARYMNDLSLKSRFEAIFEKYSQDFTEIGDEIDVGTGQIVVNNGHLESMESETDTGENGTPIQGTQHVTGKSLLRAMTVVPEVEDTYDDSAVSTEVITSIETMAENAGLVEEDSESEDDLFDTGYSREGTNTSDVIYDENEPNLEDMQPGMSYSSDDDSLLGIDAGQDDEDRVSERSESPDSLFGVEKQSSSTSQPRRAETSSSSALMRPDVDPEMSNEAILDRFGPEVGGQVLGLLEQRSKPNENHLEEAWRIPIDIGPARSSEKTATPVLSSSLTSSRERELSADHEVSLWGKQPRPQRRRKRRRKPVVQRVHTPDGYREESEDPLQEGFSRGTRRRPAKKLSGSADDVSSEEEADGEDDQGSEGGSGAENSEDEETSGSDEENLIIHDNSEDSDYGVSKQTRKRPVRNPRRKKRTYLVPEREVGDTIEVDRGDFTPISDRSSAEDSVESTPQPEDSGFCSYCNRQFSCKSSVMAHWDRLLRKPASQLPADDPHDMNLIKVYRGGKTERIRCPRLTQADFRTMVELHEGGGISFEEISDSGVLRTRKTASQLQDLYDRHRTVPGTSHHSSEIVPWSAEEDQTLQDLCQNFLVTMATLKRHLPGRDEIDIGDRLADGWLKLLQRNPKPESHSDAVTASMAGWGMPPPSFPQSAGMIPPPGFPYAAGIAPPPGFAQAAGTLPPPGFSHSTGTFPSPVISSHSGRIEDAIKIEEEDN